MTKKELRQGFRQIDELACVRDLSLHSLWFSVIRNGESITMDIIPFEERDQIPKLLRQIRKGDVVEFTLLTNGPPYPKRREKIINII